MSTLSRDAIRDDVVLMTGGHFTGTALGPVAYDEILNRARASATDYLDLFEELFLGSRFDALAQSNFQLPMFLGLMADADPTRVRRVAETLLKQYDAVLAFHDSVTDRAALHQLMPEDMVNMSFRLDARRAELRQLVARLPA